MKYKVFTLLRLIGLVLAMKNLNHNKRTADLATQQAYLNLHLKISLALIELMRVKVI